MRTVHALEQITFEMLRISTLTLPATFGKSAIFPRSWIGRLGQLGRHTAEHFTLFNVEKL